MGTLQVIATIFVLFAYSRAIIQFKDKKISSKEFFFWSVIWISVMVVAFIPNATSWISNMFGIGRPIDFIIYVSIILLFYLVFRIYVKLESLEQNITEIVRKLTIKNKKK